MTTRPERLKAFIDITYEVKANRDHVERQLEEMLEEFARRFGGEVRDLEIK